MNNSDNIINKCNRCKKSFKSYVRREICQQCFVATMKREIKEEADFNISLLRINAKSSGKTDLF